MNEDHYGDKMVTLVLTGFIKNMLVYKFDLSKHLEEVNYLDGVGGYEASQLFDNASMLITALTIKYRFYITNGKYESVRVLKAYYTDRKIVVNYEA